MSISESKSILLLGEGNFSFTLSLLNRLIAAYVGLDIKIVTTCFDSELNLHRKYPETKGIIAKLKKRGVIILYDFDATICYKRQLNEYDQLFDCIIFNFPHLGIEDAKSHGYMTAHVMHSMQQSLKPIIGCFFISLANAQWKRWNVANKAIKTGLELIGNPEFITSDWDGYEVRRHINGKNFQSRVEECSYYCYNLKDSPSPSSSASTNKEKNFLLLFLENPPVVEPTTSTKDVETVADTGADTSAGTADIEKRKKKKEKSEKATEQKLAKRKMHSSTAGMWSRMGEKQIDNNNANAGGAGYKCDVCNRIYTVEQAVVSHCYNVHVLTKVKDTSGTMQCKQCNPIKIFSSKQALQAHIISVHGMFSVLAPKWAADSVNGDILDYAASNIAATHTKTNTNTDTNKHEYEYECKICGMYLQTLESLNKHLSTGFQPQDTIYSFSCKKCSKVFSEERALRQHQNTCLLLDNIDNDDNDNDNDNDNSVNNEDDKWNHFEFGDINSIMKTNTNTETNKNQNKYINIDVINKLSWVSIQSGINLLSLPLYITIQRLNKFHTILNNRINSLRFVFENPSNINNVWAALRTLDTVGIQYVDVILENKKYNNTNRCKNVSKALGAQKWMSVNQYEDTRTCLLNLKKQGYRIAVTNIHHIDSVPLHEVDFHKKDHNSNHSDANANANEGDVNDNDYDKVPIPTVIVIGNEKMGTSVLAQELADVHFYLPMKGFAESLNMSAFCAMLCGTFAANTNTNASTSTSTSINSTSSNRYSGFLSEEEKQRILFTWLVGDVPNSEQALATIFTTDK
jgi:tRNA (guanosine-2'-O-)-methyltransferase